MEAIHLEKINIQLSCSFVNDAYKYLLLGIINRNGAKSITSLLYYFYGSKIRHRCISAKYYED